MSTHRLTLAQQLKQLESDDPTSNPLFNPDNDDSALDGLSRPTEGIHREHYLDVGPSRLRNQMGGPGGLEGAEQTLRSEKYGGKVTGRMKIFDDDEDEEEGGDAGDEDDEEGDEDEDDEDEDEEVGDEEGEEDDDEDEDEEESDGDEDDEDEDEDEEDEEGEEGENDEEEESAPPGTRPGSSKALDPIAALKDSRLKDIEKGRGIRRQRSLFENLITLRISFQKAFVAGSKLSFPLPSDPEGEIEAKRQDTLRSLAELSEKLFALREALPLPGVEFPGGIGLGKRKRGDEDEDVLEEQYWMDAAGDSLEIENASRPHLVPILKKWSSKIQAATLQLGSKQAGSSKFLASTKGVPGIVEAIEAGLASKRESDKTLVENEEASYRTLLREVIESRGAAGSGVDLTHLRREKKKKREAERGGSKGRKLRYTVHEKAQNFVVPIPLGQGWHEEQVDELFSSLFGGVGMAGAASEGVSIGVGASESEGQVGLGGLRVF